MILSQFYISFILLKMIKGPALLDFLAPHLILTNSPINNDLFDEEIMNLYDVVFHHWEMYFSGASSTQRGWEP